MSISTAKAKSRQQLANTLWTVLIVRKEISLCMISALWNSAQQRGIRECTKHFSSESTPHALTNNYIWLELASFCQCIEWYSCVVFSPIGSSLSFTLFYVFQMFFIILFLLFWWGYVDHPENVQFMLIFVIVFLS